MPNVGLYVDGVAQSRGDLLQQSMIELERLDILRGPQGTLFGRNSNGGAIQMTTKRAAEEFGGRVRAEIGNFNQQTLSASLDVPLSSTLRYGKAAKRFFRRLIRCHGDEPGTIVTDKLRSYRVAHREFAPDSIHVTELFAGARRDSVEAHSIAQTNPKSPRVHEDLD